MIETVPELASVVLQDSSTGSSPVIEADAMAALAVGLAALATGYAQRGIGAAAIGAVAEDGDNFFAGLLFVALPETLIIIALVTVFVI
jgi:V/A-type H+-transporting ATPase subunit K